MRALAVLAESLDAIPSTHKVLAATVNSLQEIRYTHA